MANSPYMREFFNRVAPKPKRKETEEEKVEDVQAHWRDQMNPANFLGAKGNFARPYAETVDRMWNSSTMFSVHPYAFKSGLANVNEDFRGFR